MEEYYFFVCNVFKLSKHQERFFISRCEQSQNKENILEIYLLKNIRTFKPIYYFTKK